MCIRDSTLPAYYTVEPTQDGEREVTIRRVGDLNLTATAYHIPSVAHPDNAALSVLGNLLGHTPVSYTHLDVYKRQQWGQVKATKLAWWCFFVTATKDLGLGWLDDYIHIIDCVLSVRW